MLLLGVTSLTEQLSLVRPVLVFFGLGFGIFTIGGVSLLMAMSADEHAASYLALWSVIQLVAKGAGIATGGVIRDGALFLSGQYSIAYAVVFGVEALGIFGAILLLRRVDVAGFAASHLRSSPTSAVLSMTGD